MCTPPVKTNFHDWNVSFNPIRSGVLHLANDCEEGKGVGVQLYQSSPYHGRAIYYVIHACSS